MYSDLIGFDKVCFASPGGELFVILRWRWPKPAATGSIRRPRLNIYTFVSWVFVARSCGGWLGLHVPAERQCGCSSSPRCGTLHQRAAATKTANTRTCFQHAALVALRLLNMCGREPGAGRLTTHPRLGWAEALSRPAGQLAGTIAKSMET